MDEASAALDHATDDIIRGCVKVTLLKPAFGLICQEQFRGTTVLTIAHRLNTILDYDRILVLHAGQVVEDGPPAEV